MSKILITGATGHLGGAVTTYLIKKTKESDISILVRDAARAEHFAAQGVDILTGDYNDYDSLVTAFAGIQKLYFVSGNDIANRHAQHETVVKAAVAAGVEHVIYTSLQRKPGAANSAIAILADSHLHTEALLEASGLKYTFLQHGLYAEVIPVFAGSEFMNTKAIYLPAGEGKATYASRADLAEAGANILLDDTDRYINKGIELTGNEAVSWSQIAAVISEVSGENISYISPSVEDFQDMLSKAGVPAEYVGMFLGFALATKNGELDTVSSDLEQILGRKSVSFASYLRDIYGK